MKPQQNITHRLKAFKPLLAEKYYVSKIGLFGSFTTGKQRPDSDLDILVEFSRPLGLFEYIDLKNFLSHKLNIPVDLVNKKSLKPNIGKYINRQVIYA